jgi:hypothetical protein
MEHIVAEIVSFSRPKLLLLRDAFFTFFPAVATNTGPLMTRMGA